MKHIVKCDSPWVSGESRQRGIPVTTWCGEETSAMKCYGSLADAYSSHAFGKPPDNQACPSCLASATEYMDKDAAIPAVSSGDSVQRKATLDAAAVLFRLFDAGCGYRPCGNAEQDATIEKHLREEVARCQANLNEFMTSRAVQLGLDALIPGWVEIDVSDLVPREKWHDFVSNNQDEWVEWIVANSKLAREKAEKLVAEKFKKARS